MSSEAPGPAKAAPQTGGAAAPPATMVIFGIRGDLAKRLLVPALVNLRAAGRLPDDFKVIGVDHGDNDDAGIRRDLGAFRDSQAAAARTPPSDDDNAAWAWLSPRIAYQRGEFTEPSTFQDLAGRLAGAGVNALFYMAVAPRFFPDIVEGLCEAGLLVEEPGGFRRVVVEKPFGRDLASARELNARLLRCLNEEQIYRIDHFLGKETVRNIMAVRFGNDLFEPVWNRHHIDSVQITAAETVGVEDRGAFYDSAGALRDMVASHLCQLMGMIAMEWPNLFDPASIRAERGRAVAAIRKVGAKEAAGNLAAGQYEAGEVGGRAVPAYRASPRVDPDSHTETFAAVRLWIDNRRWAGVPFYLRTGKAMGARNTEIALQFKTVADRPGGAPPRPNVLLLRVQPNEGVSLLIEAKRPGPDQELAPVSMDFRFADHFSGNLGTGYESLIYDALIGDPTLFTRGQDVEAGWAAIDPFIAVLAAGPRPEAYPAGSDGPPGADALIERDGRQWRPIRG